MSSSSSSSSSDSSARLSPLLVLLLMLPAVLVALPGKHGHHRHDDPGSSSPSPEECDDSTYCKCLGEKAFCAGLTFQRCLEGQICHEDNVGCEDMSMMHKFAAIHPSCLPMTKEIYGR